MVTRNRGQGEHSNIYLKININNLTPQQKTIQNQFAAWLGPNLPSLPSGYREPPRDICLEAVHLVGKLDRQKGWVDTPHHHESDLPPIRQNNKSAAVVFGWLWDLEILYNWWFLICNNVGRFCFAFESFHLKGENGSEKNNVHHMDDFTMVDI